MNPWTRGRAYGLLIESEISLPVLAPGAGVADVSVRYGEVEADYGEVDPEGWTYCAEPQRFTLVVGGVGRYLVREGREIRVQPEPESDENEVRLYLMGSAFSAVLHQRNLLALHASSIETPGGAVLFVGDSGIGKSTLLAGFLRRGYTMVADDVTGVSLDERGTPMALPGFPRVRLREDSAFRLGQLTAGIPRVSGEHLKLEVPVERFRTEPLPLLAVYALSAGDARDISILPVAGGSGIQLLARQTYRAEFLDAVQRSAHFDNIVAVANATCLRRVVRPADGFGLDELMSAIEADLSGLGECVEVGPAAEEA